MAEPRSALRRWWQRVRDERVKLATAVVVQQHTRTAAKRLALAMWAITSPAASSVRESQRAARSPISARRRELLALRGSSPPPPFILTGTPSPPERASDHARAASPAALAERRRRPDGVVAESNALGQLRAARAQAARTSGTLGAQGRTAERTARAFAPDAAPEAVAASPASPTSRAASPRRSLAALASAPILASTAPAAIRAAAANNAPLSPAHVAHAPISHPTPRSRALALSRALARWQRSCATLGAASSRAARAERTAALTKAARAFAALRVCGWLAARARVHRGWLDGLATVRWASAQSKRVLSALSGWRALYRRLGGTWRHVAGAGASARRALSQAAFSMLHRALLRWRRELRMAAARRPPLAAALAALAAARREALAQAQADAVRAVRRQREAECADAARTPHVQAEAHAQQQAQQATSLPQLTEPRAQQHIDPSFERNQALRSVLALCATEGGLRGARGALGSWAAACLALRASSDSETRARSAELRAREAEARMRDARDAEASARDAEASARDAEASAARALDASEIEWRAALGRVADRAAALRADEARAWADERDVLLARAAQHARQLSAELSAAHARRTAADARCAEAEEAARAVAVLRVKLAEQAEHGDALCAELEESRGREERLGKQLRALTLALHVQRETAERERREALAQLLQANADALGATIAAPLGPASPAKLRAARHEEPAAVARATAQLRTPLRDVQTVAPPRAILL
ncbi:hypothetical protein KFE25_002005 [Diacronema lutheri]|uniref:Uncharacterized protein n=1 Tax=Diacronema lutheri TaxID=2081491 RepID=A0A8J5XTH1_DIALT|nr:hypothetical protein KFE25_002005 [Diacronema lutheri]